MKTIENLILDAQGVDSNARKAVIQLTEKGTKVLPNIIDALHKAGSMQYVQNLHKIILHMKGPDVVPILIEILYEKKIEIIYTVIQALGQSNDNRAVDALLQYLENKNNSDNLKGLAINAIGELHDKSAIKTLFSILPQAIAQKKYEIVLSSIIALAKLGNHEKASSTLELFFSSRDISIRPRIAEALTYVVYPGVLKDLIKASRDKQLEVCMYAIDGLFYLGMKEVIPVLIKLLENKNPTVVEQALSRLDGLIASQFVDEMNIKVIKKWWNNHKSEFETAICYRLGKPIWIPDLFPLLLEPNLREQIVKELKIITGINFWINQLIPIREQNDLYDKIQNWWTEEGSKNYTSGNLYKYGFRQSLEQVFV